MSSLKNPILDAIKGRRSIFRFKPDPVPEEEIEAILEAGRWAPSWTNTQPWKFIVVKDPERKRRLTEAAVTITGIGISEAPVVIAVVADPEADPYHYVEDCAAATLNMALAAHSLGLSSFWVGVFDAKGEKRSSEERVKEILGVPKALRVISMLPVGFADISPVKSRKPLSEMVYRESYGKA
ncbi:MAG: nitroreductase family protein [Candidatus Bathyarchaeia archaeon]|nr:nitroreductase family protein [Candidatus Bathyarchaeota archaeon]